MTKKICIIFILALSCNNVSAQDKLGCVDTEQLLQRMPGFNKANQILKTYQDSLQKLSQTYVDEYTRLSNSFMDCHAGAGPLPDSIKQKQRQEFIAAVEKIVNLEEQMQELSVTKSAELFKPIIQEMNETIKITAEANGYACVLDLCDDSNQTLPPCTDITQLLIAKLGL